MDKRIFGQLIVALALLAPNTARAADDDFGLWIGASAEKKLNTKWSVGFEGEYRLRNSLKTSDRWSGAVGLQYKIIDHLKASANYKLLVNNNRENVKTEKMKWTPSYWGVRHRFDVALTGDIDLGRFNFSLRERWQYTYRPSVADKTYDASTKTWGEVSGKGRNVLRSRLKVDYNIRKCKVDPFASVELFHGGDGLSKTRYTLGAGWKISKQHSIDFAYVYQNIKDNDDFDDEPDMHVVSIAYKFKF